MMVFYLDHVKRIVTKQIKLIQRIRSEDHYNKELEQYPIHMNANRNKSIHT